jgi:hypothetical protein
MGIDKFQQWRRTNINECYQLCESYPSEIVVPALISNDQLFLAAAQRSSKRIPVLSWIHPTTGAALCRYFCPRISFMLTRSSQPLVGITTAACPEDEYLLMTIRSCAISVDTDDERSAWHCADLNLSTDDASLQVDSAWTEVIPKKDKEHDSSKATKDFVSTSLSSQSLKELGRKETDTYPLKHANSVSNIDSLMKEPMKPDQRSNRKITQHLDKNGNGNGSVGTLRLNSESESDDERDLTDPDLSENSDRRPPDPCLAREDQRFGRRLRIIDARPMMNAKGNALMGKGHEVISRLGGESCTTLDFADIPNIHVVRDSLGALRQVCSENRGNPHWFQLIHDTKWLHHLSLILKGAIRIALHLESGDPVLVHCSDGWDRTSQLVALSQLLLDPFYRTIEGKPFSQHP